MIAPELSQYSPIVRGIAYSQAQVSVKQNGVVIYQRTSHPDRLNYAILTKYSPVTEVEIREADGSVRHFTQATAVLPVLQRQGRLRYNGIREISLKFYFE